MPEIQAMQCDCGTAINFHFRTVMAIITCPRCKKIWTVDVWGSQRETTEGDYEILRQLPCGKEALDIEREK